MNMEALVGPEDRESLRRVSGVFADARQLDQYLYDCWERIGQVLLWLHELEGHGARDVLELGANPYCLTLLARRLLQVRLTLANYFGDPAQTQGEQLIETPAGPVRLPYDHFNVETAVFPYAARAFDVIAPSIASACPTIYFVAAWIDTSTPCSNGLK